MVIMLPLSGLYVCAQAKISVWRLGSGQNLSHLPLCSHRLPDQTMRQALTPAANHQLNLLDDFFLPEPITLPLQILATALQMP